MRLLQSASIGRYTSSSQDTHTWFALIFALY